MAVLNDIVALVATGLGEIKRVDGYNHDVRQVILEGRDMADIRYWPCLQCILNGTTRKVVEDATDVRYVHDLEFVGVVKAHDQATLWADTANLANDIRTRLLKPLSLGTYGRALYFIEEDILTYEDIGSVHSRWLLTYVEAAVKGSTEVGNDVYGAHDSHYDVLLAVYNQLATLKTSMAASDPTYSYLYTDHLKADLQLNAVTLGIEPSESNYLTMSTTSAAVVHQVNIEVRIHTAYNGGRLNEKANRQILNSIATYLFENIWLMTGVGTCIVTGITNFTPAAGFADSSTLGGRMTVQVKLVEGGYDQ